MLEVLYRIYEVPSEEEKERNRELDNSFGFYSSTSKAENNELLTDCILCESREQFKEIIKSTYGDNIGFRYSKKLNEGDLYCIIIGEHAYNAERYFSKVEYECSCCGNKVSTVLGYDVRFESYTLSNYLYNGEEYKKMRFCSNRCMSTKLDELKQTIKPSDEDLNFWVNKSMFNRDGVLGYIYKITKKSTDEVYIGQTKYVPIFRWGQHLKTDRFDIKNILDYQFEVIREVSKGENILEIEKEYIKEYVDKYRTRCLNIVHNDISWQRDILNYAKGKDRVDKEKIKEAFGFTYEEINNKIKELIEDNVQQ